ncbi:MAG: ribosomal-protein-alanine N-acetyltransferase [Myxococcota bacterium]|jgi:ribosomal-protein-alanine N-acetyltransferase
MEDTHLLPTLTTDRLRVRLPKAAEVDTVLNYTLRNRDFLAATEPVRPITFYTRNFWERQLQQNREDALRGIAYRFFLFHEGHIVGVANLSNIRRGALQAADVGYALDENALGKGFMTEALHALINYAFGELGLHRIMADHLPDNHRSAAVLARLGFEIEGYAKDFLRMGDGRWHDHVRTALVNRKRR